MAESIVFNGVRRFQPGVYARANADLLTIPGVPQGNLCVVGDFPKLQPATPTTYLSSLDLRDQFPDTVNQREFWRVSELAFQPLQGVAGSPSSVTFVNARTSTQASTGLLDGKIEMLAPVWGTAGNTTTLSSSWDSANNQINAKVSTQGRDPVELSIDINNIASLLVTNSGGATALSAAELLISNDDIDETSTLSISTEWTCGILAPAASVNLAVLDGGGRSNAGTLLITGAGTVTISGLDEVGVEATEEVVATVGGAATTNQFSRITSITNSGLSAWAAGDIVITGSFGSWKLGEYPILEQLITEIDSIPEMTATYLVAGTIASLDLDSAGPSSILGTTASIKAVVATLVNELNDGAGSFYGTWNRIAGGSVDLSTDISDDPAIPTVNRCGGGTQALNMTLGSFQAALASIENIDVHVIAVESDDDDVHAAVKAHIANAIALGRERNAWLGEAANLPLTTLFNKAKALNNKDISLVGQEILVKFPWGSERLAPSWLAMVLAAGQCATSIATPLTRKVVTAKINKTFQAWDMQKDIDSAISKGVVVLSRGGLSNDLRVERSVTTWLKNDNPIYSEVSANDSVNGCLRDLRRFLDGEIGSAVKGSALPRLTALARTRLNFQVGLGIISAYRNLNVRIVGATAVISFELAAVEPLNFILIEASVGRFSA